MHTHETAHVTSEGRDARLAGIGLVAALATSAAIWAALAIVITAVSR